jgi:hypothetical protein
MSPIKQMIDSFLVRKNAEHPNRPAKKQRRHAAVCEADVATVSYRGQALFVDFAGQLMEVTRLIIAARATAQ